MFRKGYLLRAFSRKVSRECHLLLTATNAEHIKRVIAKSVRSLTYSVSDLAYEFLAKLLTITAEVISIIIAIYKLVVM